MMTFDYIEIVEEQPASIPVGDLMNEINRLIGELLSKAQHIVAGGMLTVLLVGTMPQVAASTYQAANIKPEVIVDNSGTTPVVYDAASFYFHHERLYDSINKLMALTDGWDGGCAKAPSKEALKGAEAIVDAFDEKVLAHCAIFPSNDSGVFLQGRFPNGRLSLYLNIGKMTYMLKSKDDRERRSSIAVDKNNIQELQTNIISLLLNERV